MRLLALLSTAFVLGATPDAAAQQVTGIAIAPTAIRLDHAADRHRVVAIATCADGTTRDVTHEVEWTFDEIATLDDDFRATPRCDGTTEWTAKLGDHTAKVTVEVVHAETTPPVSFVNDVIPSLTRTGCNAGTCHGSASGKNGFALSLFGYDIRKDYRALTRELRGRRANPADPDASLILQKATTAVTHKGGKRIDPDDAHYRTLRSWIEAGAHSDLARAPKLTGIELAPESIVLADADRTQRIVVTARYSDGSDRDVTDLAILSSSNDVAATVDEAGVVQAKSKGETFVMARFGTFALVTQVLVLDADETYEWPTEVEPVNYIDTAIFDKLQKLRVTPAARCDDATFVRRLYLDVLQVLPTPEQTRAFLADETPDKRARLIDELLARPEFAESQAMQWADVLRVERRELEEKGMHVFDDWLRDAFAAGRPIDAIARDLLTSQGGNFTEPAANFYVVDRTTKGIAEHAAQVFMGVRIQCAQCHNHPFERWTMDDYYGFASFFSQVRYKAGEDPRERVVFRGGGEIRHPVTGKYATPKFLGGAQPEVKRGADRRAVLADWLTAPDNPFFATNVANRVFAQFFGRGIVDPVDDVRVSNPPSHPELYRALGAKLVEYGYDVRRLARDICNSHTYQAAAHPDGPPAATFAGVNIRRLTAEQMLDAISDAAGVKTKLRRLPLGARATEVVDPTDSRFLSVFGRPSRESSCTCDRRNEPTLSQVLHLINGDTTTRKLRDPNGRLQRLLGSDATDEAILEELFVAAYSRLPSQAERDKLLPRVREGDRAAAWEDVFWAILNSHEFLFLH